MTGSSPSPSRRVAGLVVGAALAALCLVALSTLGAGAAPSQPSAVTTTTCDEAYGCDTTTTEAPPEPACSLSSTSVNAGDNVTATVTNVPVGDRVDITFDGNVIASDVATADGQGETALAVAPAGHLAAMEVQRGGVVIAFRIPSSTATGTYEVRAIGPGFNANCAEGSNGVSVLGTTVQRGGGGGGFANTGIEVGLYLAIAMALILAGWQFMRSARRRRSRAARRGRSSPARVPSSR